MQIGIIGYGKMGKAVEAVALERGHQIAWIFKSGDSTKLIKLNAQQKADAAIEFTQAEKPARMGAASNILTCFSMNLPVASGTTGWNDGLAKLKATCLEKKACLLHASNFSLGMNIFFHINKILAEKLNHINEYHPSISETHHIHKKDHPSGTAITLAEQIIEKQENIQQWEETRFSGDKNILAITSHREGEIPGLHEVSWMSSFDEIKLMHSAKNRNGFALGAVIAAEFIADKVGVFDMGDVLGF